jgi:excisionase family DNA binding protein
LIPVSDVPRRLGTVKAGAQILSLGEKTIRRMIDAGKLPGVCRLGRLVRLDLHLLDKWVSQGCPPLHRFDVKGGPR